MYSGLFQFMSFFVISELPDLLNLNLKHFLRFKVEGSIRGRGESRPSNRIHGHVCHLIIKSLKG